MITTRPVIAGEIERMLKPHHMFCEPNRTMTELNDEKATRLIPAIVVISTFMFVGLVGNGHVLYIYIRKYNATTRRFYVICLAVLDVISCCLMPFEASEMQGQHTFYSIATCKIFRIGIHVTAIGSGLILAIMAIDRYRRICKPIGKHMSQKVARTLCFVAMIMAVGFSWPAGIMFGHELFYVCPSISIGDRNTTERIVVSTECSLGKYKGSKYLFAFSGTLFLIFLACTVLFATLYSLIGWHLFGHGNQIGRHGNKTNGNVPVSRISQYTYSSPDASDCYESRDALDDICMQPVKITPVDDDAKPEELNEVVYRQKAQDASVDADHQMSKAQKSIRFYYRRTTLMLFIITMVFILSFLPHLTVMIAKAFVKGFARRMKSTPAGFMAYHLLLRSYHINNMANPLIYAFCDKKFRTECLHLHRSLLYYCWSKLKAREGTHA